MRVILLQSQLLKIQRHIKNRFWSNIPNTLTHVMLTGKNLK